MVFDFIESQGEYCSVEQSQIEEERDVIRLRQVFELRESVGLFRLGLFEALSEEEYRSGNLDDHRWPFEPKLLGLLNARGDDEQLSDGEPHTQRKQ